MKIFIITWIVGKETNGDPTTGRHSDGVSLHGVDEVEFGGIFIRIIITKTLTNYKEIEAVEVKRMAFSSNNACVLHYKFHATIKTKLHNFCSASHHNVAGWVAGVIELHGRVGRKISGVNSFGLLEEVGLKEGWGEEWEFLGGNYCFVSGVYQDARGGRVVERGRPGGIRPGGDEEGGIRVVFGGFEEDIGGLARCDEDYVGFEWFNIHRISFDHSEAVISDAEEELIVQGSIDQS
nr:hypothetical protein KK1_044381 [Ipomoea batatas]